MSESSLIDIPWVRLFGAVGLVAGVVLGFGQGGLEGALVCGFVGGVIGGLTGSRAGLIVRVVGRLGALRIFDRPVRRPDLWGMPLVCRVCQWHTSPRDPWRIQDSVSPPRWCPGCGAVLDCPST